MQSVIGKAVVLVNLIAASLCVVYAQNDRPHTAQEKRETLELTQGDLFSVPNWQQKSVAVSGFALGMTRSQASQLAQTSGLRLTTNVAPKTVGELKVPCTQASCGVY